MTIFLSTANQMAFLLTLLVLGFLLCRFRVLPKEAASLLSKMENNLFVPALVLGTFLQHFTVERMAVAGQYLLCGLVVALLTMPLAVVLARRLSKDSFIRNIYTYGLAFSNFGFMGNAVVLALFPNIFMEYLVYVLPLWFFIYLWGVPALLMPTDGEHTGIRAGLKRLLNPMFLAMAAGMLLGILNVPIPSFLDSAITTLGSCMSPIAMLLTGMIVAGTDLVKMLKTGSIYAVSVLRLVVIPVAAIAVLRFVPIDRGLALCTVCALAMPLGLNTIVVPSAYGKDTSIAAGMALISHLLSCVSIPLVFLLFELIVK